MNLASTIILASLLCIGMGQEIPIANELPSPESAKRALPVEPAVQDPSPNKKGSEEEIRLLKEGLDSFDRGDYKRAEQGFTQLLTIDPHNVAARRQLEKTAQAMKNQSAVTTPTPPEQGTPKRTSMVTTLLKLQRIKLPEIQFENEKLQTALTKLRQSNNPNSHDDGAVFNFTLQGEPKEPVTLALKNVSLWEAIRQTTEQAGMVLRVSGETVVIKRMTSDDRVETRVFRLPPKFRTVANTLDPNSSTAAKTLFTKLGVIFSTEGSNATITTDGTRLIAKHSLTWLDFMETLITDIFDHPQDLDAVLAEPTAISTLPESQETPSATNGAPAVSDTKPGTNGSPILLKLKSTMLDRISFDQASLEEAIAYLRKRSMELDPFDPNKSGVNFSIQPTALQSNSISLELMDVPLITALDYVCELAGVTFRVDSHTVVVSPVGNGQMETRIFRVGADFLSFIGVTDPANQSLKSALQGLGCNFEAVGSQATFLPANGRLVVKHEMSQLEYLEGVLDDMHLHPTPEPFAKDGHSTHPRGLVMILKLKNATLKQVSFEQVTIDEAIKYLRSKSIELDTIDAQKHGVNFVLKTNGLKIPAITLEMRDVPLIVFLDQICQLAGLAYRLADHAVVISAKEIPDKLEPRFFPASPQFLALGGKAEPKMVLTSLGVSFEQVGASATYLPGNQRILIKNSRQQLDLAEMIFADLKESKAPVADSNNPVPPILTTGPSNSQATDPFASSPDPFAAPATKPTSPARQIIRQSKLKVLTKHYEETLADLYQKELLMNSATGEERTKIETAVKLCREYLSKVEADLNALAAP